MTAARVPGRGVPRAPVARVVALAAGLLLALFACTVAQAPASCRSAGCPVAMQQAGLTQLASATVLPTARHAALPVVWTVLPVALLLAAPAPALLARRRRRRHGLCSGSTPPPRQRAPPRSPAAPFPA